MTVVFFIAITVAVFLTSLLSGIFGMAGGLILLWILTFLLPIASAIAVHGLVQMVSNGSRAWMSRAYLDVRTLILLLSGLGTAAGFLAFIDYRPSLVVVSVVIGVMPILVWLPMGRLRLDGQRPIQAFLCGLISGSLSIAIGVSGPTVDLFFITTRMDRRQIIATKAAFQLITHGMKVLFYVDAAAELTVNGWMVVIAAMPFAIIGTRTGNVILHRMSNERYRTWARWIVTAVGAVYLLRIPFSDFSW
ncbi:hypothetical protein B5M44_16035 [Shinella sumterensis]|uniref:sulfite exporter TauE/SafE family protein n=1 Tax=Shinella sumterensis TaxID=1967501 RepID=UPI00106E54F0|nr:sulfite exporter TauE/SafE family protein [Shinella sumterensis]MCD1266433.1 TSUP family transporter [Shinella sumterensis]TFE97309.1 hypothetical protein B5M44_16035 [Shinella sumterensis]